MEQENDRGNLLKIVSADSVIYLDVLRCFSALVTKENCTNVITKLCEMQFAHHNAQFCESVRVLG